MIGAWTAAVLLAAQASPAPADQRGDIRCFLVAAEMADTQDKEVQAAASIMLFYFLGKLDGRNAEANLEAAIEREAEQLSDADKQALAASCSKKVEERGKQLAS